MVSILMDENRSRLGGMTQRDSVHSVRKTPITSRPGPPSLLTVCIGAHSIHLCRSDQIGSLII
jgi:hypothetical protein